MIRIFRSAFLAGLAATALGAPGAVAQDLSVGVWGLPPGLGNPFTGRSTPSIFVWDAIFEPMVRIDAEGAPAAVLAESWQPVEPMRWRFTLRDGITFSNGAPFDADAVVTTFEYLLSEEGRATPVGSEMAGIAAVEKVDDRTVDIVTDQPDPVLPSKLALVYIVEPGQWQELGPEGFAERPAGTGPFAVEAWNPGEAVLVANPNAWHAPQIERLRVVDLPERPARLQALLSGQIDVAFGLSPDNLGQLESAGLEAMVSPAPQVMSLAYATVAHPDSPFNDERVRLAANLAVNRELINEALLAGLGAPASQPGTPAAFGYDPELEPIPYDPERARALLAEAGYPDGFSGTAQVVVGSFPADSEIYQQTAIDLAQVGIDLELQQIRFPEWLDHFLNNSWPGLAFGSSWNTSPYMDSIRPYTYATCMKTNPYYCDEEIMPLVEAALTEFDPERRREILHELHAATMADPPALFLVEQIDVTGISPDVEGLRYVNRTVYYEDVTVE